MAVKDVNPDEEYPYVFMIEQSIMQSIITHVDEPPIYTVSMAWRYYKVTDVGDMVFKPEAETMYDAEYYTHAVATMMSGNTVLVDAMNKQQSAIAFLLSEQTGRIFGVV